MNSPRKNKFGFLLLLCLLLALAWLYQTAVSTAPRHWQEMQAIPWQYTESCLKNSHIKTMPTAALSLSPGQGVLRCRSAAFLPLTPELGFWTASNATSKQSFVLRVQSAESGEVLSETEVSPSRDWMLHSLSLPIEEDAEVYVELERTSSAAASQSLSVRSRLENFSEPADEELSYAKLLPISLLLSTCLLFFFLRYILPSSTQSFAAFLLFSALCIHFRTEVYFYWDEWHVLSRFKNLGWAGSIYTHNEHFLPLFFFYYQALTRLFAEHYLMYTVLSLIIHSLNALLFAKLLQRVGAELANSLAISRLLAFLFLLNSLHAEALHWAFEASLLLAQTVALLGFILAWDAVKKCSPWRSYLGAFCCGISPLFFGNGFATSFHLAALLLLGVLFLSSTARNSHAAPRFRKRLRYTLATLFFSALCFGGSAALYIYFREGAGHGVEQARPFENLEAVWNYILVGTGLGTALRGFGFYPILNLNAAGPAYAFLSSYFPFLDPTTFQPNIFFAWAGLIILLLCILISSRGPLGRKNLRIAAIGLSIMLSSLLLPAFGRWQLGVEQSLSLRYHYAALLGLGILLLPLFAQFFPKKDTENATKTGRNLALFLLLSLHLGAQLTASGSFSQFTDAGRENQEFLQQMQSWNQWRKSSVKVKSWEGEVSEKAGLQPRFPSMLTPGVHPDGIAEIMHWLAPKSYEKL